MKTLSPGAATQKEFFFFGTNPGVYIPRGEEQKGNTTCSHTHIKMDEVYEQQHGGQRGRGGDKEKQEEVEEEPGQG